MNLIGHLLVLVTMIANNTKNGLFIEANRDKASSNLFLTWKSKNRNKGGWKLSLPILREY